MMFYVVEKIDEVPGPTGCLKNLYNSATLQQFLYKNICLVQNIKIGFRENMILALTKKDI